MKQTTPPAIRDGYRYVNKYYGYLPARGYEFITAEDAFLGWQVDLRKADLFVRILHSKGEDFVSFRTAAQPPDEFFDLQRVVYAVTGDFLPISGDDSKVLPKYIDRIEAYFAGEYVRNPDGLRAAAQAYQDLLPKVEPLEVPVAESVTRPESKRFPLLYYPLMGIVLLLLFGALTTLYMVLLDRLFSAFSLDPGSYGMVMGIGAVLLAIATMLVFRRRGRKG